LMIIWLLLCLVAAWHAALRAVRRRLAAAIDRPRPEQLIRLAEIDLLREMERRMRGRRGLAEEWAEVRRRLDELGGV